MKRKITDRQIKDAINSIITIDLPDGEIDLVIEECINSCDHQYQVGYDNGYETGQLDYERENPPSNEEKLCTEYVVEKFGDCVTLDDYQSVFNELRNLSYTYM